jgi:hypothetical protein
MVERRNPNTGPTSRVKEDSLIEYIVRYVTATV